MLAETCHSDFHKNVPVQLAENNRSHLALVAVLLQCSPSLSVTVVVSITNLASRLTTAALLEPTPTADAARKKQNALSFVRAFKLNQTASFTIDVVRPHFFGRRKDIVVVPGHGLMLVCPVFTIFDDAPLWHTQ